MPTVLGGGVIWQYDFGNKSYLRVFGLFGWGVTNFSAENLGNSIGDFETNVNNLCARTEPPPTSTRPLPDVFTGSVNPYRNSPAVPSGLRVRLECQQLLCVQSLGRLGPQQSGFSNDWHEWQWGNQTCECNTQFLWCCLAACLVDLRQHRDPGAGGFQLC